MIEPPAPARTSLRELAFLFLRMGATSFGGPAAHVALMQYEVVEKRGWLSRESFLDLYSATNFIPGPNSTELAIHLGYKRRGWAGLFVAGACFIVPAALLVSAVAWFYVRYGTLPQVRDTLYGVKPVILAVIAHAVISLARASLTNKRLWALGAAALAARLAGGNELLILSGAGLLAMGLKRRFPVVGIPLLVAYGAGPGPAAAAAGLAGAAAFNLQKLFFFFLKVGSALFGSGYVLIAFLRTDLVERWGWLSEAQLLDAIAVGQFTPGPVFTTATFIGFLLAGPTGALLATIGIFLPAFFFVGISAPFVGRLRSSSWAAAMLDGLNVASLAIMASAGFFLSKDAIADLPSALIGMMSLFMLLRWRLNSAWLVLGGGLTGYLIRFFV